MTVSAENKGIDAPLSPLADKKLRRQEFFSVRDGISRDDKLMRDRETCRRLLETNAYKTARTVLLYSPIGSEMDVLIIARAALSDEKEIAFPVCNAADKTMTFFKVKSTDYLVDGAFSIKVPPHGSAAVLWPDYPSALCIVPALAFSRDGHRIGYGGGYYDRFLANFNGTSAGLVYCDLLFDTLTVERHDIPVDFVICERGVVTSGYKTNA